MAHGEAGGGLYTVDRGIDITDRFFTAYEEMQRLYNVSRTKFCAQVGADRRNFEALMRNRSRHLLRPEWLAGIVLTYGINADWLLTGRGMMMG